MTETDRLRDLLELAAPTDPDVTPAVRATRVVRRGRAARRRDRALVGGAVVTVLAAAVAVPLSLQGGDDPQVATPAPPPEPVACPAAPVDVSGALPDAPLGEITSVRACATAEPGTALPAEPLVGVAAAAFASDVRALPAYVFPSECAAMLVMPDPWALVVGSADGDPVVIGSSVRLCGGVVVDGIERDPAAVIAAFEAALS